MIKMNEIKSMYTFLKDDGKRRGIIIKLLYSNDILCIVLRYQERERGKIYHYIHTYTNHMI
jgi:hypothetical protein